LLIKEVVYEREDINISKKPFVLKKMITEFLSLGNGAPVKEVVNPWLHFLHPPPVS